MSTSFDSELGWSDSDSDAGVGLGVCDLGRRTLLPEGPLAPAMAACWVGKSLSSVSGREGGTGEG